MVYYKYDALLIVTDTDIIINYKSNIDLYKIKKCHRDFGTLHFQFIFI